MHLPPIENVNSLILHALYVYVYLKSFSWPTPDLKHYNAAAAAAKSLQLCPTLCDPIDGSTPGSPFPRIFQPRTLEWVAISFSNAWKWKWKWSHSVVSDSLRSHGLQPTRLLRPWNFPGKSTGVGCHHILQLQCYSLVKSPLLCELCNLPKSPLLSPYLITPLYIILFFNKFGILFTVFFFSHGNPSHHVWLQNLYGGLVKNPVSQFSEYLK